ncbi:hypothetical protein GCM10010420_52270 [Streptomyces glaucosporus]|uniref:Uncharacterized protein n=1 Tax=Streptomyces glaucosporus TaxID=284044 RepID=A0ABP5W2D3_9ACTN
MLTPAVRATSAMVTRMGTPHGVGAAGGQGRVGTGVGQGNAEPVPGPVPGMGRESNGRERLRQDFTSELNQIV